MSAVNPDQKTADLLEKLVETTQDIFIFSGTWVWTDKGDSQESATCQQRPHHTCVEDFAQEISDERC